MCAFEDEADGLVLSELCFFFSRWNGWKTSRTEEVTSRGSEVGRGSLRVKSGQDQNHNHGRRRRGRKERINPVASVSGERRR